jgi:glutathione S-transferase
VANAAREGPFAFGSEDPTQLDVHVYAHLERLAMMKDTAMNWLWEHAQFENYPHINKVNAAIRAHPAFQGDRVLAKPGAWGEFVGRMAAQPPGVRVQLYLPIANQ